MTLDDRLRAAQDDLTGPGGPVDRKGFVRARTRRRYGALGVAAVLLLGAVALPPALRGDDATTQVFSGDVRDLLLTAEEIPGDWQRSSVGDVIAMTDGPCAVQDDRPHRERVDRGFVTPPVRSLADLSEGAGIMDLTFLAQRVTRYESVTDAEAVFDEMARIVEACRDYDVANPDGGRTRGRLTPLDLDLDVDDHLGVRGDLVLTGGRGEETPSSADIVVFRVGDTITLLMQANDQDELSPVDGIAEAAVAKFSRAGS